MLSVPRSSIAALLVLTMFSTVLGQSSNCGASCGYQSCLTVSAAKACCGSCGNGGSCQCRNPGSNSASKSCCAKTRVAAARSCCTPKSVASTSSESNQAPACNSDCPCVRSAEFPPVPLDQQSKVADSLKLPVMNFGPLLAVLPAASEFTLGHVSPDNSPPPRAGLALRIWICSWTT
jgi:hypothetical protein